MTNLSIPEPNPIPNDSPSIHDLVVQDLKEKRFFQLIPDIEDRKRFGLEKYGVPLQAGNGRAALVEAYQEALDGICYIKQKMVEEGSDRLEYTFFLGCQFADSIRDELIAREDV